MVSDDSGDREETAGMGGHVRIEARGPPPVKSDQRGQSGWGAPPFKARDESAFMSRSAFASIPRKGSPGIDRIPVPERIRDRSLWKMGERGRADSSVRAAPKRRGCLRGPRIHLPRTMGAGNDCCRREGENSRRALSRSRARPRSWSDPARPLKARVPLAFMSANAFDIIPRKGRSGNDRIPVPDRMPGPESFERGEHGLADSRGRAAPKRRGCLRGPRIHLPRTMGADNDCCRREGENSRRALSRSRARPRSWSDPARPLKARVPLAFMSANAFDIIPRKGRSGNDRIPVPDRMPGPELWKKGERGRADSRGRAAPKLRGCLRGPRIHLPRTMGASDGCRRKWS